MGKRDRIKWHGNVTSSALAAPAVDLPPSTAISEPHIAAAAGQFAAALDAHQEANRRRDAASQAARDAVYEYNTALTRGLMAGTAADVDPQAPRDAEAAEEEAEQVAQLAAQVMPNVYADLKAAILRNGDDWRTQVASDADERVLKLASALYTLEQSAEALADDVKLLEMLAESRDIAPRFPFRPTMVERGPAFEALTEMQEGVTILRRSVAGVRARLGVL